MTNQEARNDENFELIDQDDEVSCVGLKNQGATCYMNSLLQALFHLPAFRLIVYKMPTTGNEDINKSIALNLQRLFAMMQFSEVPCSTKALTKSFGWDEDDTFMQHDLQEFSRVLIDNLETKLKSDPELHDSISNLFKGQTVQYIRCKEVPYESSNAQDFYDISLQVKDCANLKESFEKYIEKEQLNGDNQYHTDKYGLQDAEMGVEFIKFPSVLHLHLQRFQYNHETEQMLKINDKFEFPESIDLSPYLAPQADHTKSLIYDLYGVLVHSGNVYSGHYYAFLRISTDQQWYKFDDNIVTKVNSKDAIEDNFGETISNTRNDIYKSNNMRYPNYGYYQYHNYGYANYGKRYSAYMLVYIRRDDADRIMAPVKIEDIPRHLKLYAEKQKRIIKRRNEIKQDRKFNFFYVILQDEDLKHNTLMGIDIYNPPFLTQQNLEIYDQHQLNTDAPILLHDEEYDPNRFRYDLMTNLRFKIKIDTKTADIYKLVSEKFNIPLPNIRIWYQENLQNRLKIVDYSEKDFINDRTVPSKFLFLQKKTDNDPVSMSNDERLIFVKYFFPTASLPVQYVNSYVVNVKQSFQNFCKQVNDEMGITLNDDDKMLIYRQYNIQQTGEPHEVELITEKLTMKDVPSGVFIFLQIDPTIDEQNEFISKNKIFDPVKSDYDEYFRTKYTTANDATKEQMDELKKKIEEKRDRVYSIRPTKFQLQEQIPIDKFDTNEENKENTKEQIRIIKESEQYPRMVSIYPYHILEKYMKTTIDIYSYEKQDKPLFAIEIFTYSTILKLKQMIANGINENYNPDQNAMIFYIVTDVNFYEELYDNNKQIVSQSNNDDETEEKFKLSVLSTKYTNETKICDFYTGLKINSSLLKNNFRIYFLLMQDVDEGQARYYQQYTVQVSLDGINVQEHKILEKYNIKVGKLFNVMLTKVPQLQETINKIASKIKDRHCDSDNNNSSSSDDEDNQTLIQNTFRFYLINDCKFIKRYKLDDYVEFNRPIRINFTPEDQINLQEDEILIQVAYIHMHEYYNSYYGDGYPFYIIIKKNEPFGEIKKRILEKSDINKNDITGFQMRIRNSNSSGYIRTDIKDDTIISENYCPESRIYIVHKNKRDNSNSIKIYN